jgi:indolepyruvate ferredoxin oxidoreductase
VAAKVNITYKLLYNGAVAMTGGQAIDGELTVASLVDQLRAEGVKRIVICADDLGRYAADDPVRARIDRLEHRDRLDAVQRDLRDQAGVSVIIYDQVCATEQRRRRKRGLAPEPAKRLFINSLVCEGCGDCSAQSNCLSVEPVQTDFGIKRRINQSSCNKDFSCLSGFCPSFVTVEGGRLRRTRGSPRSAQSMELPLPQAQVSELHQRILVAGVGGTGVVTVGALVAMAGHMKGLDVAVLDHVGAAQKGGAVTSHVHVAKEPINALRIPVEQATLVVACDQIVGNSRDVISAVEPGRTRVIANTNVSITGDFTQNRDAIVDPGVLARRLEQRAGAENFLGLPFTRLADALLGDPIGSNLMMLGAAYQKGWISLDLSAFLAAVELNGVAIGLNTQAFEWGRRLVTEPAAVFEAAGLADPAAPTLDQMIEQRARFLEGYQNGAYADLYRTTIARARQAEQDLGGTIFTEAAARGLFKVMAYKDEYEVARLYTDGVFEAELKAQFEHAPKISFHLATPVLARRGAVTGTPRKRRFGPWMMTAFRVLARMKGLRGGPYDVFGRSAERRAERALAADYRTLILRLADQLTPASHASAARIAGLVLEVRGYGHIKEAALGRYRAAVADAMREQVTPVAGPTALAAT